MLSKKSLVLIQLLNEIPGQLCSNNIKSCDLHWCIAYLKKNIMWLLLSEILRLYFFQIWASCKHLESKWLIISIDTVSNGFITYIKIFRLRASLLIQISSWQMCVQTKNNNNNNNVSKNKIMKIAMRKQSIKWIEIWHICQSHGIL